MQFCLDESLICEIPQAANARGEQCRSFLIANNQPVVSCVGVEVEFPLLLALHLLSYGELRRDVNREVTVLLDYDLHVG